MTNFVDYGSVTINNGKEEKVEQRLELLPGATFDQFSDSLFAAFEKLIEEQSRNVKVDPDV